jgi:hypothetical protein
MTFCVGWLHSWLTISHHQSEDESMDNLLRSHQASTRQYLLLTAATRYQHYRRTRCTENKMHRQGVLSCCTACWPVRITKQLKTWPTCCAATQPPAAAAGGMMPPQRRDTSAGAVGDAHVQAAGTLNSWLASSHNPLEDAITQPAAQPPSQHQAISSPTSTEITLSCRLQQHGTETTVFQVESHGHVMVCCAAG